MVVDDGCVFFDWDGVCFGGGGGCLCLGYGVILISVD